MALELLLMSLGFNSFHLLRDEQNSKYGGVDGHKIHIFTVSIPTFHSRYRR
jgi:O-phosphoseryl-tRNA(Cys) synthetase